MANIFEAIGGGIVDIVAGWFKSQNAMAEAKIKAEVAVIESKARIEEARATAYMKLAESAQDHEQTWERIAVEQAASSWKDEWWTILLSLPIIGAFIPGVQPYILEGFANLELVPEWYLMSVGIAVAFAFGFRQLVPLMKRKQ